MRGENGNTPGKKYEKGDVIQVTDPFVQYLAREVNEAEIAMKSMAKVVYAAKERMWDAFHKLYPETKDMGLTYNPERNVVIVESQMKRADLMEVLQEFRDRLQDV